MFTGASTIQIDSIEADDFVRAGDTAHLVCNYDLQVHFNISNERALFPVDCCSMKH